MNTIIPNDDNDVYFKESEKEETNKIFSIMATTSAHDSNSDDFNTNESDFDANKSNSNIYFKSDDFNSNNKYDHELHEKFLHEEMAQLAKLEDKTSTKPAYEEDDFDKMLSEAIEEELAYFDNPAPQSVTVTA